MTKEAVEADELTAAQIMEQMAVVYSTAESYLDEGSIRKVHRSAGYSSDSDLVFSTAFVRPSQYHYRHGLPDCNYRPEIVWTAGRKILSWGQVAGAKVGERTHPDLSAAGRMVSVGTGGASSIVIRLLLPSAFATTKSKHFRSLTRRPDEAIDSVPCYCLQGTDFTGMKMTLWVEKERLLIRRTEQVNRLFGHEVTTTNRNPQINVPVPADRLAYDPPPLDGFRGLLQSTWFGVHYDSPWITWVLFGFCALFIVFFFATKKKRAALAREQFPRFAKPGGSWVTSLAAFAFLAMMLTGMTGTWSSLATGLLLTLFIVDGYLTYSRHIRLKRRVLAADYSVCYGCGYDLRGLPEVHLCPECGDDYEMDKLHEAWQKHLRGAARAQAYTGLVLPPCLLIFWLTALWLI